MTKIDDQKLVELLLCACMRVTVSKLASTLHETESRSVTAITGVMYGALGKDSVPTDVQKSQVIHPAMYDNVGNHDSPNLCGSNLEQAWLV